MNTNHARSIHHAMQRVIATSASAFGLDAQLPARACARPAIFHPEGLEGTTATQGRGNEQKQENMGSIGMGGAGAS